MHSSKALLNLVLYFLPLHISICADHIRRMQNIYSKNLRCYFVNDDEMKINDCVPGKEIHFQPIIK